MLRKVATTRSLIISYTYLLGVLPKEIRGELHNSLISAGGFGNLKAGGGELDGNEPMEGLAIDLGDGAVGADAGITLTVLVLEVPALGRGVLLGLGHDELFVVLVGFGWFGFIVGWFDFMSRILEFVPLVRVLFRRNRMSRASRW